MAKKDVLLAAFKKNLGNWTCGYCNSESNQPAATFREIKKLGYKFEEYSPNRWGKVLHCSFCNTNRTHYKLLSVNPEFQKITRLNISSVQRARILKLLEGKDAITGASISSTAEIDHKIPWTRLNGDVDASLLSDEQIFDHFQLLTREHNLLKDRACRSCKTTNIRPKFLGISYWYKGDSNYNNSCDGCGWFDANKWREVVNLKLK
jgi:uncharacterized protein YifN (PemK superfamily)